MERKIVNHFSYPTLIRDNKFFNNSNTHPYLGRRSSILSFQTIRFILLSVNSSSRAHSLAPFSNRISLIPHLANQIPNLIRPLTTSTLTLMQPSLALLSISKRLPYRRKGRKSKRLPWHPTLSCKTTNLKTERKTSSTALLPYSHILSWGPTPSNSLLKLKESLKLKLTNKMFRSPLHTYKVP